MGLIGNGTLDLLGPALVGSFARHGFALDLTIGDYDQILPEALDPSSRINAAAPDAVLLLIDIHGLPLRATPGDAARPRRARRPHSASSTRSAPGSRPTSACRAFSPP